MRLSRTWPVRSFLGALGVESGEMGSMVGEEAGAGMVWGEGLEQVMENGEVGQTLMEH